MLRKKNTNTKKSKTVQVDKLQTKRINTKTTNDEWKIYIGKTSYDVMWDWDIATDLIYVGGSIEEVFGYKVEKNTIKSSDFTMRLLPEEKDDVVKKIFHTLASSKKSWNDTFMLKCKDDSFASTISRANIIRDAKGKAIRMIGATQNVSRLQELEKKLEEQITIHDEDVVDRNRQNELEEKLNHKIAILGKLLTEYEENLKLIFNSSSDVLYDVDLVANEVMISDAYEKGFGYKIISNMMTTEEWFSHIHPEDSQALMEDYQRMLASNDIEWKYHFRFLKADGSVANVFTKGIVMRSSNGKPYRRIGYMQDVSKQKILEEKLQEEMKLKEKQIADATKDAKETERSDIGKELHDNVNQLLSSSRLYLEIAKQGGKQSKMYVNRSSKFTLMAIEEIRKLTKGLTTDTIKNFGLAEAIDTIARETMQANKLKISFAVKNFIEKSVNDKFKMNVYRIVQEQLSNILKHAKASEVKISLSQNKKSIFLQIIDNGVGFDPTKKSNGIGISNIKSRASSYNGTAAFVSQTGKGCALTLTFNMTDPLLNKK